jgi:hypothetical protein
MKNTEAIQKLQEELCIKGFTRTRMSNAVAIFSHECHGHVQTATFEDIAEVGTPICMDCGKDGQLVAVFVKESSRPA